MADLKIQKENEQKIKELEKKTVNDEKRIKTLENQTKKYKQELVNLQKEIAKVSYEKTTFFIEEFKKQTITLSIAAFGFLAALTWRDAITAGLAPILDGREGFVEFTIIALFVTALAIVIPVLLTQALGKPKIEEED